MGQEQKTFDGWESQAEDASWEQYSENLKFWQATISYLNAGHFS